MSSEEYCLVPKSTLERLSKNDMGSQLQFPNSSDDTPSYRTPPTHMLIQNIPPDKKQNPDIKHMLGFYIDQPEKLKLAESLYDYIKSRDDVKFDDHGNLISPSIKTNILEIIQYLILNQVSSPANKENIKNFIHSIKYPRDLVPDKLSRKYLYEDNVTSFIPKLISNIPKLNYTSPIQLSTPSASKLTSYKSKLISPKKKKRTRTSDVPKSDRELRQRFPLYQPYLTSRNK